LEPAELDTSLSRLVEQRRVELDCETESPRYRASTLFVPVGAAVGWEAAIFDHFQAMVKTICCRLRDERSLAEGRETVGGSTYTLDIWPGHPLEEEASSTLSRLRATLVELRKRVEAVNGMVGIPERYNQLVLYVGQCMIAQESDDSDKS
jgi:hypothetical protein